MRQDKLSENDSKRFLECVETILSDRIVIQCLDKLREFDEYTYIHSYQVCIIALRLGLLYYLTDEMLVELGKAAILHDYGKLTVPIEILTKPTRLSDSEFEAIKLHPLYGALELQKLGFTCNILRAVAEHHEGSETKGYPFGIPYNMMHLYSRLILIADIYDAMTSKRVYRPFRMSSDEVIELLLSDNKVDNHIVGMFENIITSRQTGEKL